MRNFIVIIQMASAIGLITAILIQSRGTGFARSWKGQSASFTRRGLERLVFRLTFVLASIFLLFSILRLTY